jgi:hypothetical protein
MGQSIETTQGMKVRLSTMWIFAVLTYIYGDVFTVLATLWDPAAMKDIVSGQGGGVRFTTGMIFGFSVFMEIPILMVLLARYLPFKANRWTNVASGLLMTAADAASLFVGKPAAFQFFYAAVGIACTLLIAWFAWRWKEAEAAASANS